MSELRRKNGREKPWKLDWFAVGNESWGCGGNMRPSYYADLYRQWQSFLRQYDPEHPFKKLAVGANVDDTDWTREVLRTCYEHADRYYHGFMDGLSLHYYTMIGEDWNHKGPATGFTTADWYKTMEKTLYMEDLLRMHGAIMDQYDPEKKIGLCVDEWGTWFDVEPGTNPGFLYQQNTMRDALVAGINLNIFNSHCDRVRMACIAQMVNVLQSMLLVEGDRMVKTPTYYVFRQYMDHQDAELIESRLLGNPTAGEGAYSAPALTASVSRKDGVLTATLTNLDLSEAQDVDIRFTELVPAKVTGTVVTGGMGDYNDFDTPEVVREQPFTDVKVNGNKLSVTLPKCSVVKLTIA